MNRVFVRALSVATLLTFCTLPALAAGGSSAPAAPAEDPSAQVP